MTSTQEEILNEFKAESKSLLDELNNILSSVEGNPKKVKELELYGQAVDRIMGGAKSIALEFPPEHLIHKIGDYSALCKAVGYKASQIQGNDSFYNICVALLLDATEMLERMFLELSSASVVSIDAILNKTFLDRLRWVSDQFGKEIRSTVGDKPSNQVAQQGADAGRLNQDDINDLLKKLGVV